MSRLDDAAPTGPQRLSRDDGEGRHVARQDAMAPAPVGTRFLGQGAGPHGAAPAHTTAMGTASHRADAVRHASLWGAIVAWLALGYLAWMHAPDWRYAPDVTAPLTRKLIFYHPASAWTAFAAYFVVFALGVAYLNERRLSLDRRARAAAEVGFVFNTIALVTGTLWGLQEWRSTGSSGLATVYTEPKVLVVVVTWFAFAAYLALRRLVDGNERRARLAAAFGILGFLGVPLSYATSRVLQTSLHPDIAGPGANPDAAVGATVGWIMAASAVAFLLLFVHLWLQRDRLLRLREAIEDLEDRHAI